MQNDTATLEDNLAVNQMVRELPYDPEIPPLGIYPREMKICPYKNLNMNVHKSIIYNSQKAKLYTLNTCSLLYPNNVKK